MFMGPLGLRAHFQCCSLRRLYRSSPICMRDGSITAPSKTPLGLISNGGKLRLHRRILPVTYVCDRSYIRHFGEPPFPLGLDDSGSAFLVSAVGVSCVPLLAGSIKNSARALIPSRSNFAIVLASNILWLSISKSFIFVNADTRANRRDE